MNNTTDIVREQLESTMNTKMTDKQWEVFCEKLHTDIVPELFEDVVKTD